MKSFLSGRTGVAVSDSPNPVEVEAPSGLSLLASARALTSAKLREAFIQQGALPTSSSSYEFTRFVAEQIRTWKQVVTAANIKID